MFQRLQRNLKFESCGIYHAASCDSVEEGRRLSHIVQHARTIDMPRLLRSKSCLSPSCKRAPRRSCALDAGHVLQDMLKCVCYRFVEAVHVDPISLRVRLHASWSSRSPSARNVLARRRKLRVRDDSVSSTALGCFPSSAARDDSNK